MIDVLPAKGQYLPPAHAGGKSKYHREIEPAPPDGGHELSHFLLIGKDRHLLLLNAGRIHKIAGIAGNELPPDGQGRGFSIGAAVNLAQKRGQLHLRLLSGPPDGTGETLALSPGVSALVDEDPVAVLATLFDVAAHTMIFSGRATFRQSLRDGSAPGLSRRSSILPRASSASSFACADTLETPVPGHRKNCRSRRLQGDTAHSWRDRVGGRTDGRRARSCTA